MKNLCGDLKGSLGLLSLVSIPLRGKGYEKQWLAEEGYEDCCILAVSIPLRGKGYEKLSTLIETHCPNAVIVQFPSPCGEKVMKNTLSSRFDVA